MLWEWVQTHRAVWRRGQLTTLSLAVAELRYLITQEQEAGLSAQVVSASAPTQGPLAPIQQIQPVLRGSVAV